MHKVAGAESYIYYAGYSLIVGIDSKTILIRSKIGKALVVRISCMLALLLQSLHWKD